MPALRMPPQVLVSTYVQEDLQPAHSVLVSPRLSHAPIMLCVTRAVRLHVHRAVFAASAGVRAAAS